MAYTTELNPEKVANKVNKTGDETISGNKTFAGNILPDGDPARNLGDTTHHWNEIHGKRLHLASDGETPYGGRIDFGDAEEGGGPHYVYIAENSDDDLIIHADTKLSLTSDEIYLYGNVYINSNPVPSDYDLVHTSGAETIAGKKTFTAEIGVTSAASIVYDSTNECIKFQFN